MVISGGVISPLIWVICKVTLLITQLITTHEPPSKPLSPKPLAPKPKAPEPKTPKPTSTEHAERKRSGASTTRRRHELPRASKTATSEEETWNYIRFKV